MEAGAAGAAGGVMMREANRRTWAAAMRAWFRALGSFSLGLAKADFMTVCMTARALAAASWARMSRMRTASGGRQKSDGMAAAAGWAAGVVGMVGAFGAELDMARTLPTEQKPIRIKVFVRICIVPDGRDLSRLF